MAAHTAGAVLRVIREGAAGALAGETDRELLGRFAQDRDEGAFAVLFRRHAGMVLGVCRRALANTQDAEDACQATFVVLARKAKGGRWQPSVANWLYATARKVAANARAAARRRARREGKAAVPEAVHPLDQMTSRELLAVLDEELDRLPPRYREPLVLCCLEGLTRDEAARHLGVPLGTLKIRLERGRKKLGDALTRRGCLLGAGLLLSTALAPTLEASPRLVGAAVSGLVSPAVAELARGLAVTGVGKKALLLCAATVGTLLVGIGWAVALVGSPADPTPPASAVTESQPPDNPPAGRVDALGDPLPPGAVARLGTMRFRAGMWPNFMAAAPDGSRLYTLGNNMRAQFLHVWDLRTGRSLGRTSVSNVETHGLTVLPDGQGFILFKVSADDYFVWQFTDEPTALPRPLTQEPTNVARRGTFSASAISPNARWLAAAEMAGVNMNESKLQVWPLVPNQRVRAAKSRWSVNLPGPILALAYTPDAAQLIGVGQLQEPTGTNPDGTVAPGPVVPSTTVHVWDAATGRTLRTFEASGGKDVRTFKSPKGDSRYEFTAGLGRTLALSPDAQTLYAANHSGSLDAYAIATGKELFGVAAFPPLPPETVRGANDAVVVTADGRVVIAVRRGDSMAGFDAHTGKELWQCRDDNALSVQSLAVLPDGKRFVLGCNDGRLVLYDAASGKALNDHPGHRRWLGTAAFADGGRTLITAGGDGTLRRWDAVSGKEIYRHGIERLDLFQALSFSPDLRAVFGRGMMDRAFTAGVVDTATGKLTGHISLDERRSTGLGLRGSRAVGWLPDGSLVAGNGAGKAIRRDRSGRQIQVYQPVGDAGADDGRQVESVAVSHDGRTVLLAGRRLVRAAEWPGWVALFDVASGKQTMLREHPTGFQYAAYLPDGEHALLAGLVRVNVPVRPPPSECAAALVLFDPLRGTFQTPFAASPGVAESGAPAVSPTGHQFAVTAFVEGEQPVTIYEIASGSIRRQFRGHENQIYQMTFSPDGSKLASISADLTGLVWDVAPPAPANPRALSDAERQERWQALLSANAGAAFRAMGELAADPTGTVAFLKANLKPAPAPSAAEFDALLTRLDANDFATRQAATKELDALAGRAVPRVRERLATGLPLEVRQRLEAFLAVHDPGRLTGPMLRERRAVELLETMGTPAARDVLAALARSGDTPLARGAALAVRRTW